MKVKTVIILFLIFLFLIILLQNTEVVDFSIYFWKVSMSRIILLPSILIMGFVIGFITAKIHRKKHQPRMKEEDDE
jgi:uncharacterized integral membrane protein